MKMCIRCGAKRDDTHFWRITVSSVNYETSSPHNLMDQTFQFCRQCTDEILNQISVIVSNETWPGDGKTS